MHYRGQKVAILGYGIEGKSAYDYWTRHGAKITIHDAKTDLKLPANVDSVLGDDYLQNLDGYDLVVRSPGILPHLFQTTAKVTSVTNEFLQQCPATVIGVTGSMGKGTTTSLIHHILITAGKTAHMGGNIGQPPLEFLDKLKPQDYVVLELSNVQLWDVTLSPQVAVLLVIVPEHMDWHRGNVAEYVATKANITKFQHSDDLLVYHGQNQYTAKIAEASQARELPYLDLAGAYIDGSDIKFKDQVICSVSDVPLLGQHNLENVCAAVAAVWDIVGDKAAIKKAIKSYRLLKHRLEFVAKKQGVEYYDDSIATHQLATIAAIRSFNQPKVVILGGSDKRSNFEELAREVATANIRAVILIGETAPKLSRALSSAGFDKSKLVTGLSKMEGIVGAAAELAKAGDVVLLSPATASFGLFRDYKDRGDQFKQSIKALT